MNTEVEREEIREKIKREIRRSIRIKRVEEVELLKNS